MSIHISAVINLHSEGYLCKPSLCSMQRCLDHAHSSGMTTEAIVVLDNPDRQTAEFVRNQKRDDWQILEISEKDLGAARNYAVSKSQGELVAFLDGDDLWCEDWLTSCIDAARRATRKAIWHPDLNIYFGADSRVFRHIDMESDEFDALDLLFSNLWTALVCTHRDILLDIPYPRTDLKRQLGYEDWGWNLRTIESGLTHKIVPGTVHAIRIKQAHMSLVQQSSRAGATPAPNKMLRSLLKPAAKRSRSAPHRETASLVSAGK